MTGPNGRRPPPSPLGDRSRLLAHCVVGAEEPLAIAQLQASEHHWRVQRDLAEDETVLEIVDDQGAFRIEETGTLVRRDICEWYGFTGHDMNSVWGETRTTRRFERDAGASRW
jgi:uncharacterized protein